eukprot:Opistho-2@77813
MIVDETSPSDLEVSSVWKRSLMPSLMSLTFSSTFACAPTAFWLPPDSLALYMSCMADSVIVFTMSNIASALALSVVRDAAPTAALTKGTNWLAMATTAWPSDCGSPFAALDTLGTMSLISLRECTSCSWKPCSVESSRGGRDPTVAASDAWSTSLRAREMVEMASSHSFWPGAWSLMPFASALIASDTAFECWRRSCCDEASFGLPASAFALVSNKTDDAITPLPAPHSGCCAARASGEILAGTDANSGDDAYVTRDWTASMSGFVVVAHLARLSSVRDPASDLMSVTRAAVVLATFFAKLTNCCFATGFVVLVDAALQALHNADVCLAITVADVRIFCCVASGVRSASHASVIPWRARANMFWSTSPGTAGVE